MSKDNTLDGACCLKWEDTEERIDLVGLAAKEPILFYDEYTGDAVLITVPLGCLKAESIKFTPPLPAWKHESIHRLGYGVLNKVLEFPEVFWDDTVDYFGATAEDTVQRGHCFMFWNVKKTAGTPSLIALVVGKAAIDGQCASSFDYVSHAVAVLRRIFGEAGVPCPVATAVTDWGHRENGSSWVMEFGMVFMTLEMKCNKYKMKDMKSNGYGVMGDIK
ncbi:hypothetical protein Droror1_Dr00006787 [Drosera rotundifolia]